MDLPLSNKAMTPNSLRSARRKVTLCALLLLTFLPGCRDDAPTLFDVFESEKIDQKNNLTRKDYNNILDAKDDPDIKFKTREGEGPPIPDLAPILAAPQPPKLGHAKLVSITVTDDIPLKDVLIELARLADIDIEVDASISGGIAFRAKDRPFNEVIDRIADLAGLRYKMSGGVLRVERDTPFIEIYPIDFINIDRSSSGSVSVNTNVLSSAGTGGGGGLNTGSSSAIQAKSDSDFWAKFEEGVRQILAYQPSSKVSTIAAPLPPGAPPGTPAAAGPAPERTFYILNRQGATLTVSGTQRQQELMKRFIKQMQANATSQVLIEAKIVEVTLDQLFQSGINWSRLGSNSVSLVTTFGSVADTANVATFNFAKDNIFGSNVDLDLAVRLAESFGTTRTLSSPRLHAVNNQQAVLTFAENQVYFQVKVERETTTSTVSNSTLTVNSEIKTVPIGIILMIQPSINMDTDEVTLSVRPTLSRITGFVNDPAVAFLVSELNSSGNSIDIQNRVPIVEVRELDSILKLKSGQVMVIGGLMEDRGNNKDTGLPYANKVPVIGTLFSGTNRENITKELVIFIRATIVGTEGKVFDADKAVYQKFNKDPRGLEF